MVLDMAANGGRSAVKMMVSYGGEITRSFSSDTGKAARYRYAGGENRIVRVGMSERLSELRARLAALAGYPDVRIQYAVAGAGRGGDGDGDGLDTLHDVADEHDLWVLVTRLCCCHGLASRDGRVRAFLFPINASPPRLTPDGNGGIPRPASLPSLLPESSKQATLTLPRAQSAMPLLSTCTSTPASSVAPLLASDEGSSATTLVDSGFEALAEIAAAQRSETGAAASTSTGQAADSGLDALAEIAAAQRSAAEIMSARGATCASSSQADHGGFEALLAAPVAVAGRQQRVQMFLPPPAPAVVFLFLVVPVVPVAVFFHAIPVHGCLIPGAVV